MVMYSVHYSLAALKALRKAPGAAAVRIRTRLTELAQAPFSAPNVKKLTDHPGYRLRVGDWRVIYLLQNEELIIQVIQIAQRKEVY